MRRDSRVPSRTMRTALRIPCRRARLMSAWYLSELVLSLTARH